MCLLFSRLLCQYKIISNCLSLSSDTLGNQLMIFCYAFALWHCGFSSFVSLFRSSLPIRMTIASFRTAIKMVDESTFNEYCALFILFLSHSQRFNGKTFCCFILRLFCFVEWHSNFIRSPFVIKSQFSFSKPWTMTVCPTRAYANKKIAVTIMLWLAVGLLF